MHTVYSFAVLVVNVAGIIGVQGSLSRYGAHVCSKDVKYQSYVYTQDWYTSYYYLTTCCGAQIMWCWSHCKSLRSFTRYYVKSYLHDKYRTTYFCCKGWARKGSNCSRAICSDGCGSGKCIAPEKCECFHGFNGTRCQYDINECDSSPSPCDQICTNLPGTYACSCKRGFTKAGDNATNSTCKDINECTSKPCKCAPGNPGCNVTCLNTRGSFKCRCNIGYKLLPQGYVCSDINECSTPSLNMCEQICYNKIGSYACACHSGYNLADNNQNCTDINECEVLNGGCGQICRNTIGAYHCECKEGFHLSDDNRTCDDTNECLETPCDPSYGICMNTYGSFRCDCQTGFVLKGDNKTCEDIDECQIGKPCQQNCSNLPGSFKCTCDQGYKLDGDRSTCEDINECLENISRCGQKCHNTIGSYRCSCNHDYRLDKDGVSCIALRCESISAPPNGNMTCDGFHFGSTCHFSCYEGYERIGPASRSCVDDEKWSGETAICSAKRCPRVHIPLHGSVATPCIEQFNSECYLKCSHGYYLEGKGTVRCNLLGNETVWVSDNAVCKANTPCTPSPCLHSGKCSIEKKKFKCDCTDTGYKGVTCDRGIVDIDQYPQLVINKTSEPIRVRAKPTKYIKIVPHAEDEDSVEFEPVSIIIHHDEMEAFFTVTAKRRGTLIIKYQLWGPDEKHFNTPMETIAYVSTQTLLKAVRFDENLLHACQSRSLPESCPNMVEIYVKSNCDLSAGSSGFVAVGNAGYDIPLSISGIDDSAVNEFNENKFFSPSREMDNFLKTRMTSSSCITCNEIDYNSNVMNYLITNGYFPFMMLESVSKRWPLWFNMQTVNGPIISLENLLSHFGTGSNVKKKLACSMLPLLPNNVYVAYLPKIPIQFQFLSTRITREARDKYCFAADLCEDKVHISLPKSISLDFSSSLKELGVGNMELKVTQLSLLNEQTCFSFKVLHNVPCIKAAMGMRVSGKFRSRSSVIGFNGFAYLDGKNFKDMMMSKFVNGYLLAYTGEVDYELNLLTGGKKIIISGFNDINELHVDIGGAHCSNEGTCPLCSNKGITAKLNVTSQSFSYDMSIVRFTPDSLLDVYIPYDICGGSIIDIKQPAKVKMHLRPISRLLSHLNTINKQIKESHPIDAEMITYHSIKLQKVSKNMLAYLDLGNKPLNKLISQLDSAKKILFDLKSIVKSLIERVQPSLKIRLSKQRILHRIESLENLYLYFDSSKIVRKDQGISVSYSGKFCLYQLCINDVSVSIADFYGERGFHNFNLTDFNDFLIIKAVPRKSVLLSNRLSMNTSHAIRLYLDKKSDRVHGYINATIMFLGIKHSVEFNIKNSEIFLTTDISFYNRFNFNIKTSSTLQTVSWASLLQKIEGKSSEFGSLLDESQTYYKRNAHKTDARLKTINNHMNQAILKFEQMKEKSSKLYTNFKKANISYRKAVSKYQKISVRLSEEKARFKSYLEGNSTLKRLVDTKLDTICRFMSCLHECVKMPLCELCQQKLFTDVHTLQCNEETKSINTRIVEALNTTCTITEKTFHKIYTGTCPPDPNEKGEAYKHIDGIGGAFGDLVGHVIALSPNPVVEAVGKVIGKVIGKIASWFLGLFYSCSKSSIMVSHTSVLEQPCTLLHNRTKVQKLKVSDCFPVPKNISMGYGVPKVCRCKTDSCATNISSPSCIQKNNECKKSRNTFMKSRDDIPHVFTELQFTIQDLERNSTAQSLVVEKDRKNKEFYQNQYEISKSLLKDSKRRVKLADDSKRIANLLLEKEACLMRSYSVQSNLTDIVSIREVTFSIQLPVINSFLLNAALVHKERNLPITIPFLWDLNDLHQSIRMGAKKLVNEALCPLQETYSRKRREVIMGESNIMEFPLSTLLNLHESDASAVEKSCVEMKNVFNFLNTVGRVLMNTTNVVISVLGEISRFNLPSLNRSINLSTTNSNHSLVLNAQMELIESALSNIRTVKEKLNIENILSEAKEQLDLYISRYNYLVCLNFQDCVDVAMETLINALAIFQVPRESYQNSVKNVFHELQKLMSYSEEDLVHFSQKILSFQNTVDYTASLSLHCSGKPIITSSNPSVLKVLVGQQFTLNCTVQSSLTAKIYWIRDERIMDGESSKELRLYARFTDEGFYKCLVVTLIGNVTINGTLVVVYSKPHLLSQPVSITRLLPSYMENITIVCNASSKPAPVIKWFFRSFASPKFELLPGENMIALYMERPDQSKSGYYFCAAENDYGRVKSDVARLDIVHAVLATHKLSLVVDVHNCSDFSPDFSSLRENMTINEGMRVLLQYSKSENNSKISAEIYSNPNLLIKTPLEYLMMIDAAATSRRTIIESASRCVKYVINWSMASTKLNGSFEKSVNHTDINVQMNISKYEGKFDICLPGYKIEEDGFTCGQCKAGTFGASCIPCPKGTYQPGVSQMNCINCPNQAGTANEGATSESDCEGLNTNAHRMAPRNDYSIIYIPAAVVLAVAAVVALGILLRRCGVFNHRKTYPVNGMVGDTTQIQTGVAENTF